MKRRLIGMMLVVFVFVVWGGNRPVYAQYPLDPNSDIPWIPAEWWSVNLDQIETAFNAAREAENRQLGSELPTIDFPDQQQWDSWTDNEKALFLVNEERTARGLLPLEGTDPSVTGVATDFASWLLANDAWGHDQDVDGDGVAESPWDRLHDDIEIAPAAITECHDFLGIGENLAVYVNNNPEHPAAEGVARSVYDWLYADASVDWGHRHALLWDEFTDNSGDVGSEGLMGISVQTSGPYQGPFEEEWPIATMIVFNVYDPCGTIAPAITTEGVPPVQTFSLPFGQWIVGAALLIVVVGSLMLRRQPVERSET